MIMVCTCSSMHSLEASAASAQGALHQLPTTPLGVGDAGAPGRVDAGAPAQSSKRVQRTALYRHFDSTGRLLYVGISLDYLRRLGQHKQNSGWFDRICRVEIEWLDSRQEALAQERSAIRREKPECNIALQSTAGEVDPVIAWGVYHELSNRLDGWYFRHSDGLEMLEYFSSEYPEDKFILVGRRERQSHQTGLRPLRPMDSKLWARTTTGGPHAQNL
jgi:predicted GIY-YIG superfamily endonuclease